MLGVQNVAIVAAKGVAALGSDLKPRGTTQR
jgi:hypothetical protein